ncbi:MAG TPA: PAS domain S-box protein, partial [Longimicrobiales bacterium]
LADNTAHYIAVNDAACRLTGRSREELLSLHVSDLTPPRDAVAASADILPGWHLSLVQAVPPVLLPGAHS